MRLSTLVAAGFVLAIDACAPGLEEGFGGLSRRDSAGVAISDNESDDAPFAGGAVHLADLMTPDSALTALPWGVVADPGAQRVYVADATGARVAVFDGAGAFVEELGRAGEGPGEFRGVSALALAPEGTLVALDARRGVLSRWSRDGEFEGEERLPASYWGPGFAVGGGAAADWFATVGSATADMSMDQTLAVHTPRGAEPVHVVRRELSLMELPCVSMPAPKVFAPDAVWASRGDTLWFVNGDGFRIDGYARGAVFASVRRAAAPAIRVTRAMAMASLSFGPGPYGSLMRQCGVTAGEVVDATGYEEVLSPIVGFTHDPAGGLWVSRRTDGLIPEVIDVFGAEGGYLGTLDIPAIPVGFASPSRLVAVRPVLDTGEIRVSLYEVGTDASVAGGSGARDGRELAGGSPPPRIGSVLRGGSRQSSSAAAEAPPRRPPEPNPAGLREFRDCDLCPVVVEMPPGGFVMGRAEGEDRRLGLDREPDRPEFSRERERPRVRIEFGHRFAIGKYEVTFDEWDRCVVAGGCDYRPEDRGWGRGDRPVIHVSYRDAEMYLAWLAEETGRPYRLPSSAEWEYAARAGTTTARWWGDEVGSGHAVCDECGLEWEVGSTAPTGSLPPNPWGLHDMLGNVSELAADCWTSTYDEVPTDGSPVRETSRHWREGRCLRPTWRGGAFSYFRWTVRSAWRSGGSILATAEERHAHPQVGGGTGFRVALTLDATPPDAVR
ncbi:SUMF1/EgtB/PvdO family nonheme iron enzyme [Candidatus Palauibacter soopunensis]|uniref:SUMF1/EgtB/PvdO family nonheme iron enzyme n=1 Tax=Candidatus Palauibacter soopunensis TaxID=3056739 RepID=UPI002388C751|nr:SUMF1/EgtB/PvdO family nonheme iron enzyme [Candidatus Palauibacter soopunensis]MDE2878103.1 SUMF1/EgtB/PvdO family nonheme iron enzyme [Candidatus Palauibacter soopunensis]